MNKKLYWRLSILITLLDTVCILFLLHKHGPHEAFDLFEAFFRYQFILDEGPPDPRKAAAYFLEIEGKDPPSEFMVRFAGHSPPIKNGSEFVSEDFANEGLIRSDGLLFRIKSWRWAGWGWFARDHAKIRGGYGGHFSGYTATYILKSDKKGWIVDRVGYRWHWDGFGIEMIEMPSSP